MLFNDFYTTHDINYTDNSYGCRIVFNVDHSIFGGHFPGKPVVPGVCMMEIVKELLQQKLGTTFMLRTAGNVKFLGLITPDVQPQITITWKQTEEGYKVIANFKNEAAFLFKLDGHYKAL